MREIRATTETAQKVQTKLGEELVTLLTQIMRRGMEDEEDSDEKENNGKEED